MLALRMHNLVYVPLPKIGSTSYIKLFRQDLQWSDTSVSGIDWTRDHVFAHIIHPGQRHTKGTMEAIKQHDLAGFLHDERMLRLLSVAFFDLHSYPISVMLGEHVAKIDWLVADHADIDCDTMTVKFLADHGIIISPHQIVHDNVASQSELDLRQTIAETRKKWDLIDPLMHLYQRDFSLYNEILNWFDAKNFHSRSWQQISWLNNRGY